MRSKNSLAALAFIMLSACHSGSSEKSYLDANSFPASCQGEALTTVTSRLKTCSNKTPDPALTELCLGTLKSLYDGLPAECRSSIDSRELMGRAARTITKNGIKMVLTQVQAQAKGDTAAEIDVDFSNIAKFTVLWMNQFEDLYFDGSELNQVSLEQKLGREYSISEVSADILQTIQSASTYAQKKNAQAAQANSQVEPVKYSVYAVRQYSKLLKSTVDNYRDSKDAPLFFAFIVSQVLGSMQADVEAVGSVHDMICSLSSCDRVNDRPALAIMVDLVAAIGDENSFRQKFAQAKAAGVFNGGGAVYLDFFTTLDNNPKLVQDSFTRASTILNISPVVNGRLLGVNVYGSSPQSLLAQSFLNQLQSFQLMAKRYETSGYLVTPQFGGQSYPFSKSLFTSILSITSSFGKQIDDKLSRYTADRANYLNTLRAGLDDASQIVSNSITEENQKKELLTIASDIEGLETAIEDQEEALAGYASQLELLKAGEDRKNSYEVVQNLEQIQISAADAVLKQNDALKRTLRPADYAVAKVGKISLEAGQILVLDTSGRWAPRCALRKNTQGELLQQIDTITTGPEGYIMSVSTDKTTVISRAEGKRTTSYRDQASTSSLCLEVSIRATPPTSPLQVGGKASACENYTSGKRTDNTIDDTTTNSDSFRATANYASGVRMPESPFDRYPVGSLLAFAMPKTATDGTANTALDVRVLSGRSTIIAERDVDVYLVVNDCIEGNTSQDSLGVSGAILASKSSLIEAERRALFAVVGDLRTKGAKLLKEGVNIGPQLEDLKQSALAATAGSQALSSTPALQELFRYWISHEVLQLGRKAQIEERRRQYSQILGELNRTLAQKENLKSAAMLRQLQIKLELDNLDQQLLTDFVTTTSRKIVSEFAPIINFYFEKQNLPKSLRDLAGTLQKDMRIDTPVTRLASVAKQFIGQFDTETAGWSDSLDLTEAETIVGLRFPSPIYQDLYKDPSNPTQPVQDKISYLPRATNAQSLELWNAFFNPAAKSRATVNPDFSQLYGTGNSGNLNCNLYKATISDMAVMFVTKNSNVSENTLKELNATLSIPVLIGPTTRLTTKSGPQELSLSNGRLNPSAKIGFITDSAAANFDFIGDVFRRTSNSGAGAGLSPFTNIEINTSGIPTLLKSSSIQKVFGIEPPTTSTPPTKPGLPFKDRPEKSTVYPSALTDIIVVYALRTLSVPADTSLNYIETCR